MNEDDLTAAYMSGLYDGKKAAQREWVGLTDEERSELLDKYYFDDPSDAFMREFEAKLKEKNT